MSKVYGFICTFIVAVCLVGCGKSGGTAVDNASQDDIQAYEDSLAEEENMMNEEFTE